MNKAKSSEVLAEALLRIRTGTQRYACAAIQDVETDLRYANNGKDVKSNALKTFQRFKPTRITESTKNLQEWWPVGDIARIDALEKAIELSLSNGD